MQAGTPCTIAAGNDGQNGIFDTSGAGDAMGATGIGSIDSTTSPIFAVAASYAVNGVEEADFPYLSATAAGDFGTTNLPLYAITLDTTITNDACSALDPSTPDLSSYVVLVWRGSCTFSSKIANVAAFGVCFFHIPISIIAIAIPKVSLKRIKINPFEGKSGIDLQQCGRTYHPHYNRYHYTRSYGIDCSRS